MATPLMDAYIQRLEAGILSSLVKEAVYGANWYDPGYPESPIKYETGYDPSNHNVYRDVTEGFPELCHFYHPGYSVVKIKSETYFYFKYWLDDRIAKVILRRKEFYAIKDTKDNYFVISKKILHEIGLIKRS